MLKLYFQGELLAHILNGVINRPVRDALLLNHALTASKKDHLRRERRRLMVSQKTDEPYRDNRRIKACRTAASLSVCRVDFTSTYSDYGLSQHHLCMYCIIRFGLDWD